MIKHLCPELLPYSGSFQHTTNRLNTNTNAKQSTTLLHLHIHLLLLFCSFSFCFPPFFSPFSYCSFDSSPYSFLYRSSLDYRILIVYSSYLITQPFFFFLFFSFSFLFSHSLPLTLLFFSSPLFSIIVQTFFSTSKQSYGQSPFLPLPSPFLATCRIIPPSIILSIA